MSLAPGTRLGPYEVTAQIGVGGMGEVYRATDTNLGRPVAIKVLPAAFAQDPERLARFEREAKTLALLNHPNIATIHGVEKAPGSYALVMELVEGPTLADRIAQGAVPIDEAGGGVPHTAGGHWQVSTAGGVFPVWRRDGKEVNYVSPAGAMMAVPITVTGSTLAPRAPEVRFSTHISGGGVDAQQGRQYDVVPDGRFLINTELDSAAAPITLLMNWNPEARK